MNTTDLTRAYVRLHLAEGVGSITFRKLLDAFGDIERFWQADAKQWQGVEGVGPKTAAGISAVTDAQVDEDLAAAEKLGVQVITLADPRYPAALKTIYDPPPVLYVRGELRAADALAFGVVGSRHCTHYGMEQAERFGGLLARAGFTLVSGGARGIDTAAHRGALTVGGRTAAVMGCGLCHTFPPENAKLFDEIADGRGALVSEFPMLTTVDSGHFPKRNRIISGLSLGVLVVEAARRSGALITSTVAVEQGRSVFAIPGRVDSVMSQGTNDLIRTGAILVQCLEDILEHLGEVGTKMTPEAVPADAEPVLPFTPDPAEAQLLELLKEGPMGLDDLVRRSGLGSGKAVSTLTMLVIKGAVAQRAGNQFMLKRKK